MLSCEAIRPWLQAHLDGERTPLGREVLDLHLEECAKCRGEAEALVQFTAGLRRVHAQATASASLQQRVWAATRPRTARRSFWIGAATGAVALLVASVGALTLQRDRSAESRRLVEVAVAQHESTVGGEALDFRTSDPAELTRWIAQRLAFPLTLPKLDNPALTLVGARLVQAGPQTAAYVVYRRADAWISLAVVPAAEGHRPKGAGGDELRNLKFHFKDLRGHHVITWTDHDLTYALVSDLPAQGRESCGVCHAAGAGLSRVDAFHRLSSRGAISRVDARPWVV